MTTWRFSKEFTNQKQVELPFTQSTKEVIAINEAQIKKFVETYWTRGTSRTDVRDRISPDFIRALAVDAAFAKKSLRDLFKWSPYWCPDIQALKIDVVHKYKPNYYRVRNLILRTWRSSNNWYELDSATRAALNVAAEWLAAQPGEEHDADTEVLHTILPRKYWRKKKTTIYAKLSEICGLAELSSGTTYVRTQEEIAYWFNGEDIPYTIYISLDPAQFLSSSNPKHDDHRLDSMVSCHSFNGDCQYKSGCVGYARDSVTFAVFTLAHGSRGMFNTKKARQLFSYYNGYLLQSRLYSTRGHVENGYGGIDSEDDDVYYENKEFRQVVQDIIAQCEGLPESKWKFTNYKKPRGEINKYGVRFVKHEDFGGYYDVDAFATTGMIKICRPDNWQKLGAKKPTEIIVGAAGLHIESGLECASYADIDSRLRNYVL